MASLISRLFEEQADDIFIDTDDIFNTLGDVVLNQKEKEATEILNGGLDSVIEYLLSTGWTDQEIRDAIK
jgi:hypothetical protein